MPVRRATLSTVVTLAGVAGLASFLGGCGDTAGRSPPLPRTVARAAAPHGPTAPATATRQTIRARVGRAGHVHAAATTAQTTEAAITDRPLAGQVVGVDPGHNGANATDLSYIDHQIWNGREYEDCNTTGTETDAGYTEARFNWNVGEFLVHDLEAEGARVVLTRHSNDGVGPCVNRRAQIMNQAHVAVAVAIHADGGPAGGRGFAILEPVADGINDRSLHGSYRFARILRRAFRRRTGMPVSTYDGVDGLTPRDDLAGENLTREPYALIECGNMRNSADAALLTSSRWQRRAAAAIAAAITGFLSRRKGMTPQG